jgi:thymidylate kinase
VAPGTFVTVSGIDGSGKSTFVAELARLSRSTGCWPATIVLSPLKGDPILVKQVRDLPPPGSDGWLVREQWLGGYFSLRLAIAAQAEIRPALDQDSLVIADRWVVDHLVNQAYFGVDLSPWKPMLDALPRATVAAWIDAPPQIAQARIAGRGRAGVGSGDAFLTFVAARFNELMAIVPHVHIDGRQPAAANAERLLGELLASRGRGG